MPMLAITVPVARAGSGMSQLGMIPTPDGSPVSPASVVNLIADIILRP